MGRIKGEETCYPFPMPPRCRVTFYDTVHQMNRTLVIEAGLPLVAAEKALEWLIQNHVLPEDLAKSVKVEVVTTAECTLAIDVVEGRARITAATQAVAKAA